MEQGLFEKLVHLGPESTHGYIVVGDRMLGAGLGGCQRTGLCGSVCL